MADQAQLPLIKGTVDLLVLKALSWGPMHGFGISLWLEEESGGALNLDDSATYQVLHRLEARGYIDADWQMTENNRRARYYSLTNQGRQTLRNEIAGWRHYVATVTALLEQG